MTAPASSALGKVFANNGKAKKNEGVSQKPNFLMAHPQKLSEGGLNDILGQFDLQNPTKQSNGVIKGNTLDGGSYHVTPGVIKFTKGKGQQPPPYQAPANDNGGGYPPPATAPAADASGGYPPAQPVSYYA